jgi:predicted Zn-dependent protease
MRPFSAFLAGLLSRCRAGAALALCFVLVATAPVLARGDQLTLIRDAEIEHYLRDLATPVFRAAGLDPASVSITIIQSSTVNAFVAGGMNLFLYTGLLQMTETPEQLLGVIAHETGHIAGGHLIRGTEAMSNASAQAIIGTLLGVAAGIASGNGALAAGAISGSQQIAERGFLSFSRAQEASADAAGLNFLDRAGVTAQGMEEFMQKLAGQEMLPSDRQAEYVRTHPLTQDRIDAIVHHAEGSPLKGHKLDARFAQMHARMKAKLLGFIQPETALLRYTDKDPRLFARYARAVALYRTNQLMRALSVTDSLLRESPQDPFFLELKGQMLFDNGRVDESVGFYKAAVEREPTSSLLRLAYARAMLESKQPQNVDLIIQQLLESNRLEERVPETWRALAAAWGRKAEVTKDPKDQALVAYALAEEAVARGADREAAHFADRALRGLPKGSPYWLRAQDIKLSAADPDDHGRGDDDRRR